MKKILYFTVMLLTLASCERQLDIIPKGKTTLSSLNDLELLLNQEYWFVTPYGDLTVICNESAGMSDKISDVLSQQNTLKYAYLTYSESVNRAELTVSDERYTAMYKAVNYMNTILDKIDEATGDESRKPAIAAEARVMRAYIHWLLVNIYAGQYDESTAAQMGGIAYVTDVAVGNQKSKNTLEEVYRYILEDCADEVIELLPTTAENVFRPSRVFGYAVRAKVLVQMKRYAEAIPYALKALDLNGAIEDRSAITADAPWNLAYDCPNNYIYIHGSFRAAPFMEILSFETSAMFEPNDYNLRSTDWINTFAPMYSGLDGCYGYFNFTAAINEFGLTSDRMYYTLAECYVRTDEITKGLETADRVRAMRIENYSPFATRGITTEKEAMKLLQPAIWIENLGTFENFFNAKRWNSEADYRRTITRDLKKHGKFTLKPDSPLWILPFPSNAVRYNPSLTQNY